MAKMSVAKNRKLKSPSSTKTYKKTKTEIEKWVNSHSVGGSVYSKWYCGITNNPNIRKASHKYNIGIDPYFFNSWCMQSFRLSKALETSFHNAGMLDKDLRGGAKENSWYIYVYKKYPTIFDILFK